MYKNLLGITDVVFGEFHQVLHLLCPSTIPRPVSPVSHQESFVVGMESRNSHHTFFVQIWWLVCRSSSLFHWQCGRWLSMVFFLLFCVVVYSFSGGFSFPGVCHFIGVVLCVVSLFFVLFCLSVLFITFVHHC